MKRPSFFDETKVAQVYPIDYVGIADCARRLDVLPATTDRFRTAVLGIDVQNSFCIPGYELFVGGRSGIEAVECNARAVGWLYENTNHITSLYFTLDKHRAWQIFHQPYWIDINGEFPKPGTIITESDLLDSFWTVNPAMERISGESYRYLSQHAVHYVKQLALSGKQLIVWPFHCMQASVGNAMVSVVEEFVHYHSIARHSEPVFIEKGQDTFTEMYSGFKPEVPFDHTGRTIGKTPNINPIDIIMSHDTTYMWGHAKSHCVKATVTSIMDEVMAIDKSLLERIFLIEDASASVVLPSFDFTDSADEAYRYFAESGINIVRTDNHMIGEH